MTIDQKIDIADGALLIAFLVRFHQENSQNWWFALRSGAVKSRSLKSEFEVVIMVEVLIGEMFGSNR